MELFQGQVVPVDGLRAFPLCSIIELELEAMVWNELAGYLGNRDFIIADGRTAEKLSNSPLRN